MLRPLIILFGMSLLVFNKTQAQDSLGLSRDTYLVNIELKDGRSLFAKSIQRTPTYELIVEHPDSTRYAFNNDQPDHLLQ